MAIGITGKFKPDGDFSLMDAVDIEMPDGSRLPDALKKVNGYFAGPVPPENKNVLWLDTSEDNEQIPDVIGGKDGMILQMVDGTWTAVSVAESSIAAYIDKYISDALGGEY